MIFVFLIVLVVALAIANFLVIVTEDKKTVVYSPHKETQKLAEEVGTHLENIHEKHGVSESKIKALGQKINLLSEQIKKIEEVVAQLAKQKISNSGTTSRIPISAIEMQIQKLIDFKNDTKIILDVMETEITNLKGKKFEKNVENEKVESELTHMAFNNPQNKK